ncbi:MAG: hypothetical protein KAR44_05835 [Candidatus Aegiribacteria sp.]|nr:hypothetical protein [Candidatus Aegiribacteria sp.]
MRVYLFRGNIYFDAWRRSLSENSVLFSIYNCLPDNDEVYREASGAVFCKSGGFQYRRTTCQIIKTLENSGVPVYPSSRALALYDDKVTQAYELQRLGIPSPITRVFWNESAAHLWLQKAVFPIVSKTSSGAGSAGVTLIRNKKTGHNIIKKVFRRGIRTDRFPPEITNKFSRYLLRWILSDTRISYYGWAQRISAAHSTLRSYSFREKECILFQEFIPNNSFDYRITVIGNRAFGMRRFNRQGDFRASGSSQHDYDPTNIPEDVVQLAFSTASILKMKQSMATDILMSEDKKPCIVEVSYDFANAHNEYPGFWDENLKWIPKPCTRFKALSSDFCTSVISGLTVNIR